MEHTIKVNNEKCTCCASLKAALLSFLKGTLLGGVTAFIIALVFYIVIGFMY